MFAELTNVQHPFDKHQNLLRSKKWEKEAIPTSFLLKNKKNPQL